MNGKSYLLGPRLLLWLFCFHRCQPSSRISLGKVVALAIQHIARAEAPGSTAPPPHSYTHLHEHGIACTVGTPQQDSARSWSDQRRADGNVARSAVGRY